MTKEYQFSAHYIVVDGDVLPWDDDKVEDVEALREREPDIDADLLGFAQRIASRRRATQQIDGSDYTGSEDLRSAIEERDGESAKSPVHEKVMEVLHEAALEENKLRSFGASAARIMARVDTPLRVSHMKLGFDKDIDRTNMFPLHSNFIQVETAEDADAQVHTIAYHRKMKNMESDEKHRDARESAYKD